MASATTNRREQLWLGSGLVLAVHFNRIVFREIEILSGFSCLLRLYQSVHTRSAAVPLDSDGHNMDISGYKMNISLSLRFTAR